MFFYLSHSNNWLSQPERFSSFTIFTILSKVALSSSLFVSERIKTFQLKQSSSSLDLLKNHPKKVAARAAKGGVLNNGIGTFAAKTLKKIKCQSHNVKGKKGLVSPPTIYQVMYMIFVLSFQFVLLKED